jgi:hypothetical protein
MDKRFGILSGLGIGAGLMYLFDPDRGRRRRLFIRDKAVHIYRTEARAGDSVIRQIINRTRGAVAESKKLLSTELVDDDVLVERIRAMLGRVVSHPGPIEITAADGHVTLGGHILKDEIPELIAAVKHVPGVKRVENIMHGHAQAEDIAFLRPAVVPMVARYKTGSSPTARMLTGGLGGALTAVGLRRGGALGGGLGVLGLGMLIQATSARQHRRLTRAGSAAQRRHAAAAYDAERQEVSMAAPAFRDNVEDMQ